MENFQKLTGQTLAPKVNSLFTDRQLEIYEQIRNQKIRIVKTWKPGKKAKSQISGKTGSKATFWAEYQLIDPKTEKPVGEHKFLSHHDLDIYFGKTFKITTKRVVTL